MTQPAPNYTIETYQLMPTKMEAPVADYQSIVDGSIAKYGVKWIYNKKITEKVTPVEEPGTSTIKRRKRDIKYIWYIDYKCHRSGKKENRTFPNISGKHRELQKASKKNHCPARLKVTCFKHDPEKVTLETIKEHNHQIGGSEDLQHLPLSKEARTFIEDRLNQGYRNRNTRLEIQQNYRQYMQNLSRDFSLSTNTVSHRDQMVHTNEIYNIYKKIQESFYKRADDQRESIRLWLDELNTNSGYKTYTSPAEDALFSFAFSSPWQQQLLLQTTSLCIDVSDATTNNEKGILYTVLICHPLTGTGCPVAYLFTEDQTMAPIKELLLFLRDSVGLQHVHEIILDVNPTEVSDIQTVYPQAILHWCLFHVTRAWMTKIRTMIKSGNATQNAQVQKSLITSLKSMMWEKDVNEFNRKLAEVFVHYANYHEFLNYIKTSYLDGDEFVRWSAAFQPRSFSIMENNSFMESWHNLFKLTYLEKKKNRRIDRLMFILVNDVEPDYISNTNRIQLNVGRMGPEERKRRQRELDAEAVNEEIIPLIADQVEGEDRNITTYNVKSFTIEEVSYSIKVVEEEMKSCNCPDFTMQNIPCKHMYLLKRFKRNIILFTTTQHALDFSTTTIPPEVLQTTTEDLHVQNGIGVDIVTGLQASINASIDGYMLSPHQLTDTQIQSLLNTKLAISAILNNHPPPSN